MKLPSLLHLREQALSTLRRFPLVLLVAVIGTAQVIAEVKEPSGILACALGLPLLLSIALFGERNGWREPQRLLAGCGGLALLVIYYALLPAKLNEGEGIRFLILDAGLHALVAFAPYVRRGEARGFWQFNQRLFLGITTSALYSATLAIGLSLALVSAKVLFNLDIRERVFLDLNAVIFGIINTWFFLARVPRDFAELDQSDQYPRGLKVFSQFVLLPLVVVYLAIIYLYILKILLQWHWPNGLVSGPIIGLAVMGILSLLLLYPIRNREGNRWIALVSRWFYAALLPLAVVLLLAVWKRISAYGLTESRYVTVVVAFWLAGIGLYFLFVRRRTIETIPVSLCILALLSAYGPWSAHELSINNQLARLRHLLEANRILVNGRFHPVADSINFDAVSSIQSSMYYLDERGMVESIRGMGHDSTLPHTVGEIIYTLNINAVQPPTPLSFRFEIPMERLKHVTGFDYALQFSRISALESPLDTFRLENGRSLMSVVDLKRNDIYLYIDGDTLRFQLDSLIAGLEKETMSGDTAASPNAGIPLTVEAKGRLWRGRMDIYQLDAASVENEKGRRKLASMNAWLMLAEQETGDRAEQKP